MKIFFTFFLFLLSTQIISAQSLTPEEASKKVGENVQVCGKIFGGRYFETSKGSPTLLNMGAAFPASPLTIMIPGDIRSKLNFAPEVNYKDKNICVTGIVILFKDKPEIVINNISQITIQE